MTQTDSCNFTYLPVSNTVNRLGFYVTGVGSDAVPKHATYPREKHPELYDFTWQLGRILPEFQFLLVSSGQGEFESEEMGVIPVTPGSLIMLFPDVWHRYRPDPETGWTEHWISLGGDLLFQWMARGLFSPDCAVRKLERPEEVRDQYESVIKLAMSRDSVDSLMLSSHALTIVINAIQQDLEESQPDSEAEQGEARSGLQATDDEHVLAALRLIWNHSHQRISIAMIAKQVGVNRRTLERRFRQQLGKTLLEELVECRIERAKRMLRETQAPIKYVAYSAGFSSLSNLCKVFRREVGITPGDYREQMLKDMIKK